MDKITVEELKMFVGTGLVCMNEHPCRAERTIKSIITLEKVGKICSTIGYRHNDGVGYTDATFYTK